MKRNLFQFLFGESQVDEEIASLVEDIADIDTEGVSDLKVDKAPLAKALKSLDIDTDGLEHDPRGFSLVVPDGDSYRDIHAILNTPDSIHKLASAGWVFSTQGDVAQINEPAEWRIRFLEITTTEANNENPKPTRGTAKNTAISDVIKKGREFASKKPEHYDTNPVEFDHEGSDSNKGVSAAKDGEQPEGKPKGSTKESVDESEEEWLERLAQKMFKKPYAQLTDAEKEKVQQRFSPMGFGEAVSAGADVNAVSSTALERTARKLYRKSYRELRGHERDKVRKHLATAPKGFWESAVNEAGHKAGCTCGFCKNKGKGFGPKKVADDDDKGEHEAPAGEEKAPESGAVEHTFDSVVTPAELVDKLLLDCAGIHDIPVQGPGKKIDWSKRLKALRKRRGEAMESNPGTPPGILGHKSYPGMKVASGNKDRKFKPAIGMVQAHDEGSVVNSQVNRHAK